MLYSSGLRCVGGQKLSQRPDVYFRKLIVMTDDEIATKTRTLLSILKEETDRAGQLYTKPTFPSQDWRIPTLKKDIYRIPSPMLKCRFEFAGTWFGAEPGKKWLSLWEMENVWSSVEILTQLEIRKEYWEDSIVGAVTWDELSLLGVDLDDGNETYLHWTQFSSEPRIVHYFWTFGNGF